MRYFCQILRPISKKRSILEPKGHLFLKQHRSLAKSPFLSRVREFLTGDKWIYNTVNFHKDIRNISDHVSSATSITEGTGYGAVADNR